MSLKAIQAGRRRGALCMSASQAHGLWLAMQCAPLPAICMLLSAQLSCCLVLKLAARQAAVHQQLEVDTLGAQAMRAKRVCLRLLTDCG